MLFTRANSRLSKNATSALFNKTFFELLTMFMLYIYHNNQKSVFGSLTVFTTCLHKLLDFITEQYLLRTLPPYLVLHYRLAMTQSLVEQKNSFAQILLLDVEHPEKRLY